MIRVLLRLTIAAWLTHRRLDAAAVPGSDAVSANAAAAERQAILELFISCPFSRLLGRECWSGSPADQRRSDGDLAMRPRAAATTPLGRQRTSPRRRPGNPRRHGGHSGGPDHLHGDCVIGRDIYRGTQTGEFMGIPASGNRIEMRSIDIWRVKDGMSSSTGTSSRCSRSPRTLIAHHRQASAQQSPLGGLGEIAAPSLGENADHLLGRYGTSTPTAAEAPERSRRRVGRLERDRDPPDEVEALPGPPGERGTSGSWTTRRAPPSRSAAHVAVPGFAGGTAARNQAVSS